MLLSIHNAHLLSSFCLVMLFSLSYAQQNILHSFFHSTYTIILTLRSLYFLTGEESTDYWGKRSRSKDGPKDGSKDEQKSLLTFLSRLTEEEPELLES